MNIYNWGKKKPNWKKSKYLESKSVFIYTTFEYLGTHYFSVTSCIESIFIVQFNIWGSFSMLNCGVNVLFFKNLTMIANNDFDDG